MNESDSSEVALSRRSFIKTGVSLGVVGGGVAGYSTPAHAETGGPDEYWAEQPDHVTIEYDDTYLNEYRPYLVTSHLEETPTALYGWVARSDEHDTTVCVYFTYYPIQTGLTPWDSHYEDREPVLVFVDDSTGDIERIVYSGYHWLASTSLVPNLTGSTNPTLRVVQKWHHYTVTPDVGETFAVRDLHDKFNTWLKNGWNEALAPGTCVDPWRMRYRDSWWRDSAFYGLGDKLPKAFREIGWKDGESWF